MFKVSIHWLDSPEGSQRKLCTTYSPSFATSDTLTLTKRKIF